MPLLPPPYSERKSSPPSRSGSGKSSRSRSLIRSRAGDNSGSSVPVPAKKHRFTLASLRGNYQPELSRRLFRLIKSENYVINSYEAAGHERQSIATQLSEWGEQTGDDCVNELSDKLGVLLSGLGAQEEVFAQNLEEYRSVLKQIRNTESSVQPSRDHKAKIQDEINKLRYKDPNSSRITILEQELVRAEAENLVAEAQLTNVMRSKLKEAFAAQFVAVIERAEKQTMLARHGLRMLNLLDDTPVVVGEPLQPFEHEVEARQIIADADKELQAWSLSIEEEVMTNAHVVAGGVVDGLAAAARVAPSRSASAVAVPMPRQRTASAPQRIYTTPVIPLGKSAAPPAHLVHPANRQVSYGSEDGGSSSFSHGSGSVYDECGTGSSVSSVYDGGPGDVPHPPSESEKSVAAGKGKMKAPTRQAPVPVLA